MDLLTPAERQQIKDAFRDVMDTYSRTPVTVRIASVSVDRFNEDRVDITYTDYSFDAIVLYGKNNKQNDPNLGGAVDILEVEAIVHLDVLDGVGLLGADDTVLINVATDLLVTNGQEYRIKMVSIQGQVDKKQVKAHIKGQIEKNYYP